MPGSRSRSWRYGLVAVVGRSMEPSILDGDRLLVHWGAQPVPGRAAVVRLPDDRPLAVKRLFREHDGGWWVERDNPTVGVDSWLVGAIPTEDVLGLVIGRVWPIRWFRRIR